MYLKRLEVQGFKSLADRTELQFNPGITAVVGPNGSGKSNISDAIRWVLGEQSAKSLRGAKMEDIIFSGSEKRKPVGMAEVVLTIDNSTGIFPSEYSEITVTRRVFRSGESEFFINKTPCRLKDIHELFMDTGIGREGYSIIGQGKIDEILSTKSEDRRILIEEAAGIVKYKNRKLQAAKKLTDTEQNLIRINDIISELENQVGPLAEQASKARCFRDYKEELDRLEINILVHQLGEQKERLSTLAKEQLHMGESVIALETEIRKTESEIEELKHNLNKTNEEINSLQQHIYDKNSFIEKLESEVRVNNERINNLVERKDRLESEIEELKVRITDIEKKSEVDLNNFEELNHSIIAREKEISALEQALAALEEDNRHRGEEIERVKGEIIDTLNGIAGLNNRIHGLQAEEKSLSKRGEQLTALLQESQAEQKRLQIQRQDFIGKEETVRQALATLEGRISSLNDELEALRKAFHELSKELRQLEQRHQNHMSKLKVLEEMEQDYEGYHKGVKEVLKAGKAMSLPGICGVVAEIIKVSRDLEAAIEVALGGAVQFIVTGTEKDAKDAIAFLKKGNIGRATFLPLNTIKPRSLKNTESLLKVKGCLGIAAELVTYDSQFKPAINSVLGSSLVAKDMEAALNVARTSGFTVKVVTLEGDVINPGGSLTGGSYNKNRSNLLVRKGQITELKELIKSLEQELANARQKEKKLYDQEQSVVKDMEDAKLEIQQGQLTLAGMDKEIEQVGLQLTKSQQSIEVYQMEKGQLDKQAALIKEEQKSISVEIEQLHNRHEELKKAVETGRQDSAAFEAQRNQNSERLTTKKVDLAKIKQEQISCRQNLERVMAELEAIKGQINLKSGEIGELNDQNERLKGEIQGLQDRINVSLEDKLQEEAKLEELKNTREYLVGRVSISEEKAKNDNKEFMKIQNQIHSIEIRKARLETEIENQLRKLLEEFALTYEEAVLRKTQLENKREALSRIKTLKHLIAELGAVNLAAIEEYDRVKERYEFLQSQYTDLEEARLSLYKVIEEMEQIMSKRFRKAYDDINQNFSKVFEELFGGGHAELQMTDKERLLDTGIEIIAQPPGKKPQHLSLLSGGERALTAISLLFAVLLVKPTPFCVLDEIEASLDEANVDRFAGFLQRYSQETQFIVVTHRKGTMESANVLYGVTIDETGVSKMVSMKLSDTVDKVS